MSVNKNERCSESYLLFSKKLKVFLFKIPLPGNIGALGKPNLSTRSCRLIHKSSSLILHSSYCWKRWDIYLASSFTGRDIVGCFYFQASSGTSIFSFFWPGLQGVVLQALDSLIGGLWHLCPATGGLHPLYFTMLPPPQTWSQMLQSPRSSMSLSCLPEASSFI